MKTLQNLLDEGYTFADESFRDFSLCYAVDYNALLEDNGFFYDKERKLILNVPVFPDITPESIEIQYFFGGEIISGKMLFNEEHFQFTYKGQELENVLEELVFQYSDFAYDIKQNYEIRGLFSGVALTVVGRKSTGEIVEFVARYYPSAIKYNMPEAYTGLETYVDGQLRYLESTVLLYQLYDIQDLKGRIKSLIKA